METLSQLEQTYVCVWSHGGETRKHLHIAVQAVTVEVRARYDGLRSEQLQTRMLADGSRSASGLTSCSEQSPTTAPRTAADHQYRADVTTQSGL
ncbi:hypothetical protein [Streptomyces sp. NPDC051218]|uniref:hypothetical protein n=1 Tax=Streptomyces sp. NPDC051218 TaxID=3365645 RepID=UPI0037A2D2ED